MRTAVKVQMKYLFPAPVDGHGAEIVGVGPTRLLGYFARPELNEFLAAHAQILERANVITSSFILTWAAATVGHTPSWMWQGPDNLTALFANDTLMYFSGSAQEQQFRLNGLELEEFPPVMSWDQVLIDLVRHRVRWSRLGIPYQSSTGPDKSQAGAWFKLGWAIGLIGFLFCAGQGMRWMSLHAEKQSWQTALTALYRQALGDTLGSDPHGQLLFRLEQLKGSQLAGIDVIKLMQVLSDAAPSGFRVESMALDTESGTIRAKINDYKQLEHMLATLAGQPAFQFTLEQATNAESGVIVDFKVDMHK